jgi:hypothetical protein
MMMTLRHYLRAPALLSAGGWLFLPKEADWSLQTPAIVLAMDEVPPEQEDEDDAGYPAFAREHQLQASLSASEVESVVTNARLQKAQVTDSELLAAFLHYYDNDAYIELPPA